MYQCPETEEKLIPARAAGGTFWYGKSSRGRMLTVVSAKHFIGVDGVREIWTRALLGEQISHQMHCPSCRRFMKIVFEPQWMGSNKTYVCTLCHVLWLGPDQHPEVPRPEDFLYRHGDSTAFKDVVKAQASLKMEEYQREAEKSYIVGDGPQNVEGRVFGFLGLPVEMGDRDLSRVPWVTYVVGLLCILLLYIPDSSGAFTKSWGFYPDNPGRHGGANIFTSVLMHSGWAHLLGNLYFFKMLGDDVEDFLGHFYFFIFLILSALACALGTVFLSARPDLPHVGLSGVVTACICCHAFLFPKNRVAFFVPVLKFTNDNFGFQQWRWGRQWFRFSILSTAIFWVSVDLFYYFVFEKNGLSSVAYSEHIAGAAFGFVAGQFYRLFRRP